MNKIKKYAGITFSYNHEGSSEKDIVEGLSRIKDLLTN